MMIRANEEERKQVLKLIENYLKNGNVLQSKIFSSLKPEIFNYLADRVLTSAFERMMADSDLVSCAIMMMENNLNVSEASRNAFVHRNTLIYRINKVQKLTGLNIKNFEDAFLLKVLMVIYYEKNRNN